MLAGLSVAFDASCEEMWLAWRHAACLVPAPRALVKTGTDLGPWLVERGITVISTVPTLLALWPVECLERVRLVIVGGESCPPELVERVASPQREFWNTYGPTETTVVATAAQMFPGRPVRIGGPLDGWEIAVMDEQGHPVPWGGTGELVIGGVGTARYLDPAKDAEKYGSSPYLHSPRVYRSGDLVRADPDGLIFVGRADEQVKLSGRRIELGEVDAALQALPGVRAAAAAVRRTPAGGELLVGYLVLHPGAPYDPAAARALLLERLPQALVPVLATVDGLPTKTSGKVDRNALPWPLATSGPDPSAAGPRPTGTAGWLAEQWEALLGMPVGADGDFFVLGGTSLAAAKLVSVLRTRCPGISVADIYAHPGLLGLAAKLDELSGPVRQERRVAPDPAPGRRDPVSGARRPLHGQQPALGDRPGGPGQPDLRHPALGAAHVLVGDPRWLVPAVQRPRPPGDRRRRGPDADRRHEAGQPPARRCGAPADLDRRAGGRDVQRRLSDGHPLGRTLRPAARLPGRQERRPALDALGDRPGQARRRLLHRAGGRHHRLLAGRRHLAPRRAGGRPGVPGRHALDAAAGRQGGRLGRGRPGQLGTRPGRRQRILARLPGSPVGPPRERLASAGPPTLPRLGPDVRRRAARLRPAATDRCGAVAARCSTR